VVVGKKGRDGKPLLLPPPPPPPMPRPAAPPRVRLRRRKMGNSGGGERAEEEEVTVIMDAAAAAAAVAAWQVCRRSRGRTSRLRFLVIILSTCWLRVGVTLTRRKAGRSRRLLARGGRGLSCCVCVIVLGEFVRRGVGKKSL